MKAQKSKEPFGLGVLIANAVSFTIMVCIIAIVIAATVWLIHWLLPFCIP